MQDNKILSAREILQQTLHDIARDACGVKPAPSTDQAPKIAQPTEPVSVEGDSL